MRLEKRALTNNHVQRQSHHINSMNKSAAPAGSNSFFTFSGPQTAAGQKALNTPQENQ
jgi:hypothetical protein